ncbi:hypothetical protein G6F46_014818 [Rhizopus delemar]|nr:hypothetical protein G6F46_014818 [Rhizopus delemar]
MDIRIDEGLRAYIDPLTEDEHEALERSLLAEGAYRPRVDASEVAAVRSWSRARYLAMLLEPGMAAGAAGIAVAAADVRVEASR